MSGNSFVKNKTFKIIQVYIICITLCWHFFISKYTGSLKKTPKLCVAPVSGPPAAALHELPRGEESLLLVELGPSGSDLGGVLSPGVGVMQDP